MFRKAERKAAKARIALSGVAGSGKTYSSILIAKGLGQRIAMIDTENGSGELYSHIAEYDVLTLKAPFTPEKYIEGIKEAEKAGYDVLIIDSLSHAWAGEGGLLDLQGKIADSGKGNSYTAWRSVTPKHNALVEAILQSSCHIIATMRAKTEYVQQSNNGKTEIKKVGLAPIQRDGMEYEFTIFFDIASDHTAIASKDRTSVFDGIYFKPSKETGLTVRHWLEGGKPETAPVHETSIEASETFLEANETEPMPEHRETANKAAITSGEFREKIQDAKALPHLKNIWEKYQHSLSIYSDEERQEIIELKDKRKKELVGEVQKKAA